MPTLIAYKNDPKLKQDFVAEVKWHQDQDMIIQGTYGEGDNGDWRGCAVGCSIHSLNRMKGKKLKTSNHKVYETELGMPEWLARLEDTIFEGLPKELAMKWPLRFAQAVPVGADLEPVKWKFCAYLMKENIDRVLSLDISDELKEQVVYSVRGVLNLHEEAIKTGKWDESAESAAWSAARSAEFAAESAAESAEFAESAARSAAWSAARSAEFAAWSAAEFAAESAAWSAAESAESAAWSAAWSAAESAEFAAYERHADKLIELLEHSAD